MKRGGFHHVISHCFILFCVDLSLFALCWLLILFYVCVLLVIYYYSCSVDFGFCSTYLVFIVLLSIGLCGVILLFFYPILLSFNLLGVAQFIKHFAYSQNVHR
jgi:hypothetical protein